MSSDDQLPTFADVQAAAARLDGMARRTPLLESDLLNERVGGRLLVKAEPLQRTGSFKFRGAYNAISRVIERDGRRPVVAFSSGNHAQGVALAAKLLGVPATIVMPSDAPLIKRRNTEAYGAGLRLYDRLKESREDIGAEVAQSEGAALIKPFDDVNVIAGQGTVGLEIAEQAAEANASLDAVLICCGGGGLTAGCTLALKEKSPDLPIHAVEPEAYDDTRLSLEAGERRSITPGTPTLCDAIMGPAPGELTFAINRSRLESALVVSDDEALEAMATAFGTLKLVIEPGGAVALAAALSGRIQTEGRTIAVVASGGNVDPAVFSQALNRLTR
ncbi:MAG: threonine/serine dehydratase [Pseudomonadota bacterium]